MCLLIAAHRVHPRYPLAIAANRDERHERPTAPMHRWPEAPGVLAGRDLVAGGTWLGIDTRGRFGAVTNFHEPAPPPDPHLPSRGALVTDWLRGTLDAAAWLAALEAEAPRYAGFNLLIGDGESLWYASNRVPGFARALPPGIYGVSNHVLGTAWPKTARATAAVARWVDAGSADLEPLHALLLDDVPDPASGLPWPASSGPFVNGDVFGTRSVTWLARDAGEWQVGEENFRPRGVSAGMSRFHLGLE